MKFGRLTVLNKETGRKKYWLCRCKCGVEKEICYSSLKNGDTKSCGCYNREMIKKRSLTHGFSISSTKNNQKKCSFYRIWTLIKDRCNNKKNPMYKIYGGRGIKVCKSWGKFENFKKDMWSSYQLGLSIDRINNNGNYKFSNCRWATSSEQANNRRSNRRLKLDGKSKTIAEWSRETGIKRTTLIQRIEYGWPIKEALTTPPLYNSHK